MTEEQAASFERFFKGHFHEMQVYAHRYVEDWRNAEEMVMDAFAIASEKIDIFLASDNQTGWMKRVVQNVCRNHQRGRAQEVKLMIAWDELTEGQVPFTEDNTDDGTMEECRALLTEDEFRLLRERVMLDMPFEQLAEKRGIGVWACRKRVSRILDKLRKHFREENNVVHN